MTPEEKQTRRREAHRAWRLGPGREKYQAKRARYRAKHADLKNERQRVYTSANPERVLWTQAKNRAKMSGRAFDIELPDIVVPEFCPLLGVRLEHRRAGSPGAQPNSPSLDRIDNAKGYVKGNVWVISHSANTLKGTMSVEEFRAKYLPLTD